MAGNWAHQDFAIEQVAKKRADGFKSICVVAPCGAGKSRVMRQLAEREVAAGGTVRIYLHRTMLLEQMVRQFAEEGFDYGVLAAGWPQNPTAPIQLCMADSVYSKSVLRDRWSLGNESLILWDECHNQTAMKARALAFGCTLPDGAAFRGHLDRGAVQVGFTASPVGMGDFYQTLVQCGNYSQMRKIGAHSRVRVYSPSEMDLEGLKRHGGEYEISGLEQRVPVIFGDVFASWQRLNPLQRPAILFAPSVPTSRWFAEEFCFRGVAAAHIDGSTVSLPKPLPFGEGYYLEDYEASSEVRDQIIAGSKDGSIKVVCNRFVLREAIDMPWLYHGIIATAFGSFASYLQSVGRVQRYWDYGGDKIIQDHGGNYHRHGSPNADVQWELGATEQSIAKARIEKIKKAENPADAEGICCPKCFVWRQSGPKCPGCGHSHKLSVRRVRTIQGELKMMRGTLTKKPKKKDQNTIWTGIVYSSVARGQPASSAVFRFVQECRAHGIVPDFASLRNRPPERSSTDWHRSMAELFPWARRRSKS